MTKSSLLCFITLSILCQSCNNRTQTHLLQKIDDFGDALTHAIINYKNDVVKHISHKFNDFEYDPNQDTTIIVSDDAVIENDDLSFNNTATVHNNRLINIVAVGDIMIGSFFPNTNFLPPNDGRDSFKYVKPHLKGMWYLAT